MVTDMSEFVSYSRTGLGTQLFEGLLSLMANQQPVSVPKGIKWDAPNPRLELLKTNYQLAMQGTALASMGCSVHKQQVNLATSPQIQSARAMMAAIESIPNMLLFAEQTRGQELASLRQELAALSSGLESTATTPLARVNATGSWSNKIAALQDRIETLAINLHKDVLQAEKQITLQVVSETLADLGYQLESRGDVLRAKNGQTSIYAEVDESGRLDLDTSGFTGKSCLAELQRVEEELSHRGLALEKKAVDHHEKPEGGVLAQKLEHVFPRDFVKAVAQSGKKQGTRTAGATARRQTV